MEEWEKQKPVLIEKYKIEIEAFKQLCQYKLTDEEKDNLGEEPFEELDFRDMSIGFFIAKGVSVMDAFDLAIIVRYDFQYWC